MKKFTGNPFDIGPGKSSSAQDERLEWEESALDDSSRVEGFVAAERQNNFFWIYGLIFIVSMVIVGRLFQLQIIQGARFGQLAEGNRLRVQTVLAPRGIIKDRYGETLAQNTASFSLVVIPADLPKQGLEESVTKLVQLFGLDQQEVLNTIKNNKQNPLDPVILKRDLTSAQNILFQTNSRDLIGFDVETIPVRDYISPEEFSHVIGYAGVISGNELVRHEGEGYRANDYIGKLGLELQYENDLRGSDGQEQIEVNALGQPVKVLGSVDPIPGNTEILALDKGLQENLYHNFITNGLISKGAAVAMNPKTGEVLALVSTPGFNNNLFAHGISQADYSKLTSNPDLPLFNRAVSGVYPPGSTVKPMVALAALEEHIVTPKTVIYDGGVLVIPNQFNPAQTYNFYGWKRGGLGPMTVTSAIAESSDIYFYTVAGGHPNSPIKGLGVNALSTYYRKFNLGKPTGIDLQGEKSGVVADPDWKANYFKGDAILSQWYLGDTYHVGIGQGDMLATPLQVALWTSIIANNGTGMKPHLLDKVINQDGQVIREVRPEVLVSKVGSEENIKVVQQGMRQTVTDGSGKQLSTLPITSAGKTGTSQFDGSDPSKTHAWFTCYAPFEDPQIVVTVLVEAGGEGHVAAEPIAKRTLEWWTANRYNK